MATLTAGKDVKPSRESDKTAPSGDFYEVTESLNAEELKI
jgi:hypothetical protein